MNLPSRMGQQVHPAWKDSCMSVPVLSLCPTKLWSDPHPTLGYACERLNQPCSIKFRTEYWVRLFLELLFHQQLQHLKPDVDFRVPASIHPSIQTFTTTCGNSPQMTDAGTRIDFIWFIYRSHPSHMTVTSWYVGPIFEDDLRTHFKKVLSHIFHRRTETK